MTSRCGRHKSTIIRSRDDVTGSCQSGTPTVRSALNLTNTQQRTATSGFVRDKIRLNISQRRTQAILASPAASEWVFLRHKTHRVRHSEKRVSLTPARGGFRVFMGILP